MNELLMKVIVLVVLAGLIYIGIVELWTAWRNRRLMKQQPTGDVAVGDQLLNLQTGTNNVAIGHSAGYSVKEPLILVIGDVDAPFGGWITNKEEMDAAGLEHYYEIAPNGHRIGKTRPKTQEVGEDHGLL